MPTFPVDHNEQELLQQFQADFTTVIFDDPQPVLLEINKHQAWVIFSTMQLALRHPDFPNATADLAKQIAIGIQEVVATTPALAEIAQRGWDPEFDS